MINQNKDYFTTYDLNLSALLVALNFPLEKIEKNNTRKALFHFKKSKELDQLVANYWKQEVKINPQKLFDALKFIKNRLYSDY